MIVFGGFLTILIWLDEEAAKVLETLMGKKMKDVVRHQSLAEENEQLRKKVGRLEKENERMKELERLVEDQRRLIAEQARQIEELKLASKQ